MSDPVNFRRLPTGVPGMDDLLGGGIPEYSFNVIAGAPGSGKTTLAHQLMFAHAGADCRALYFTVLGEPTFKMLRYQQLFKFFDVDKMNKSVRFVNLSDVASGPRAFEQVLARIEEEVRNFSPRMIFVDSFRALVMAGAAGADPNAIAVQQFLQQMALFLSSWQATTFLIGEYQIPELDLSAVITIADSILVLSQSLHRNAMVRKVQVLKIRGQAQPPGLHTFRISDAGIEIFPRAMLPEAAGRGVGAPHERLPVGNPVLDEMLGGGIPAGYSLLVVGPSGSGKTILSTAFLAEGVRRGETGVLAAFEKSPSQLLSDTLKRMVDAGRVGLLDTRSLAMSIDEMLHDMTVMIERTGAKRLVIDSLSGFALALAPEFSDDFRSSLYRMNSVLASLGVTVLMTSELEDRYTDLRFSPFGSAFLADAIIIQRYIQIDGEFKRVISVMKVRASTHSHALRLYEIAEDNIVIGSALNYEGILSARPTSASTAVP